MAARPALVLFGHGARDAEWALPFGKIRDRVAARNPALTVELAFLELMVPTLPDAIAALAAAGHERITVAPLFIAPGGHLKNDLPKILDAIRARHPRTTITLLPALGEVDAVLGAIADWLAASAR
ncbi:MAG TPA: CbiX/SirB N-terminal domain-containing protein [Burkholderiales bacterium]|nr:CbiX/SirB N-terminal domain-containing protein [Burkholderiales bacterium]